MAFERTKSGQQNRAAFSDVDYICYVEGGGGNSDFSDDVVFWERVFQEIRPDLKVRFLARGGKPELEARANDIVSKNIDRTLVAMDCDYDHLLGDKLADRRVLYTFGYSWENDVLSKIAINQVYAHAIGAVNAPEVEIDFLQDAFDRSAKDLIWPVRADYYALVARSSVFPRAAPGRIIQPDSSFGLPIVKRGEVRRLCSTANQKTSGRALPPLPKLTDAMRFCVGKIFAHMVRVLLCGTLKRFGRSATLSRDHLVSVSILLFPEVLRSTPNEALTTHYTDALNDI